ncbi:MAG TPA: proline--tRNA ligase [Patescibacteria group bacterium]|nr:proline--tRNA ligase [Patescibacteria group bacterium]
MKYSQLPFKTTKTIAKDLQSKNSRLLTQAGYIHKEIAGVYTFLPLGLRVLNKIEAIIREEMDTISAELFMPSLAPIAHWEKTKRFHSVDVLMKTTPANEKARLKNDTEYVLSPTHEDMVTPLVQEFVHSYKDLPVAVYQIQTKFRNEPRAKSGLLRCREFRMKDLYSFHMNEEDLKRYYEIVKEVYFRVFEKLGLKHGLFLTLASGGDFTKDYSHEFQVVCDAGEDIIFHVKSKNLTFNREVAPSMAPTMDQHDEEEKPLAEIEGVGMIGVEEVAKHIGITVEQTTKTLLFEDENHHIIAATVRGGYDVNEEKLQKIAGVGSLTLASAETVKKVTGAEVGYAGLLNLPKDVKIFMDESLKGRRNFEMGANKTGFHSMNVNFGRDLPEPETFYDLKTAKEGDKYPETGEVYEVYKAAEVGNIFPLNVKFSESFGFTYIDEKGQKMPIYMGSYGIGPSRVMGVIVEKFADEKGLIWPHNIAPYTVHLISLNAHDKAGMLYKTLEQEGVEIFYDDRGNASAGEKFADADLMGMPVRLVISGKTGDSVEWKERGKENSELISVEEVITRLKRAH